MVSGGAVDLNDYTYTETDFVYTLKVTYETKKGKRAGQRTRHIGETVCAQLKKKSNIIAEAWEGQGINVTETPPNLLIDEEKVRKIVGGTLRINIDSNANK